jgi:invasion protein IalB
MTHRKVLHGQCAFVLAAATMIVAASTALAQQPPQQKGSPAQPAQKGQPTPPAKQQQTPPAQRPAQPAPGQQPQQPAQAPAQQPPPLIYSQWVKFCLNEQGGSSVCFTGKDARIETGMMVASAALIEPQGDQQKKLLRINVPLAMKLEHGTRILIDQTPPRTAPYVACFVTGCVADYEINVDVINQMKKSQQLSIQAIGINGQPFTVPLPLAEFAKAYDGPPTDPKVIEEQQKKLEEEFTKKREELMRQQQQNPSAGQQQPGKTQ